MTKHKMKLFCDASFDEENKTAITAFVIYDKDDNLIYKTSIGHKGVLNSFHAELIGLEIALNYIKKHGYYNILVITDVRHVVTKISNGEKFKGKPEYRELYNGFLKRIKNIKKDLKCEFLWVNRRKNKVADKLTKKLK